MRKCAGACLFVYGTLRSDVAALGRPDGARRPVAAMIANGQRLGPASLGGRLYDVGRYPALVWSRHGGALDGKARARGEVWRLKRPVLALLDAYEGPGYRRVRSEARLDAGGRIAVYVYVWRIGVDGLRPIPSGDYLDLAKRRHRG